MIIQSHRQNLSLEGRNEPVPWRSAPTSFTTRRQHFWQLTICMALLIKNHRQTFPVTIECSSNLIPIFYRSRTISPKKKIQKDKIALNSTGCPVGWLSQFLNWMCVLFTLTSNLHNSSIYFFKQNGEYQQGGCRYNYLFLLHLKHF
jgi:hypothetical protein